MTALSSAMRRVAAAELGEVLRELADTAGVGCGPPVMGMLAEVFAEGDAGELTFEVQAAGDPGSVRSALALCALAWMFLDRRRVLWVAPSYRELNESARMVVDRLFASPDLARMLGPVSRRNGAATVETQAGGRLMFRTLPGARGVSCDKLVVDDGDLPFWDWRPVLVPCLAGREHAQVVVGMPSR